MDERELYIITYDYPYGNGEPFLETEITFAKKKFKKITIISVSNNKIVTRIVPNGIKIIKLSRNFKTVKCGLYAMRKMFTALTKNEYIMAKSIYEIQSIKILFEIFKYYLFEKRILEYFKDKTLPKVIYNYWFFYYAIATASNKEKLGNAIIISRMHSFEVKKELCYIPFRTIANSKIDKIYAISNNIGGIYKDLMNQYKVSAHEVLTSRLGVLPHKNIYNEKKDKIINIVSCSSIIKIKRLDIIIMALSVLKNDDIQIIWNHFGDGDLKDNIIELANLYLSNKIKIEYKFWGSVSNSDLLNYYKNNVVDIFVNTSDDEGIPVSIMEAMSYGIPCIARDVGGNSEILEHDKNGLLLKNDETYIGFSSAIDYIINLIILHDKKYFFYRNNAINTIKVKYNCNNNYSYFYNSMGKI